MGPMRKSRLSKYKQDRLIEHFVAGTTARTASSLCGVNRKAAAFYFLVYARSLPLNWRPKARLCAAARLKWTRVILGARERESGDGELPGKSLYLAC